MKKFFFLLGPACSGKGTQGHLLNIPVVSAGDILRKMFKNDLLQTEKLNKGEIIDPNIVNESINNYLKNIDICLIDGYPRTIEQAMFVKNNIIGDITYIILSTFETDSYQILLNRTLKRSYCDICQRTFNIESKCCNKFTIKRNDDIEDIFKKRYKNYHDTIFPILNILEGPFFFIDFSKNINEINLKIKEIIK